MSVKKELNEMLEAIGVKKKQQPQIQSPLNPNFKGCLLYTSPSPRDA